MSDEIPTVEQVLRLVPPNGPRLNRSLALEQQWKVSVRDITSRDELRALYPPWYRTHDVTDVEPKRPNASKVTIGEIADNIESWPTLRDDVLNLEPKVSELLADPLPAYALPNGSLLLLDGNHRAVAQARSEGPFAIRLFVLNGPPNEEALEDLIHFQE